MGERAEGMAADTWYIYSQGAAEVLLRESWGYSQNLEQRSGSALQGPRLKLIEQASELYAHTKEHVFESKATEEQAKLLRYSLFSRSSLHFAVFLPLVTLMLRGIYCKEFEELKCMGFGRLQQELESATGQPIFVDSSVSDTIRTCISLGNHRTAQRIRVEFKVFPIFLDWLQLFFVQEFHFSSFHVILVMGDKWFC